MRRILPMTSDSRYIALSVAKYRKDNPPASGVMLSDETVHRLDIIFAKFSLARTELSDKEADSTLATAVKDALVHALRLKNSHYIQELNFRIVDNVFPAEYRKYYNISVISAAVPAQDSEDAVELLSKLIIAGEPLMIAGGGHAITYPTLVDITSSYALFQTKNGLHTTAQLATRDAKKALNVLTVEVDAVIKKVWDEVETYFNEESKESMHIDARDWGVVYVSTGKPLIISGHLMQLVAGVPIAVVGAKVTVLETDETTITIAEGALSLKTLATGKVNLRFSKTGFKDKDILADLSEGKNLDLGVVVMELLG